MSLGLELIEPGSFRAVSGGWAIDIRLAWYRSLPLSCIERVRVAIDGAWAADDDVSINLNDQSWPLSALPELVDEVWFVTDAATVAVRGTMPSPGVGHRLETEIAFRAPSIEIGPGRFLVRTDHFATTQAAA